MTSKNSPEKPEASETRMTAIPVAGPTGLWSDWLSYSVDLSQLQEMVVYVIGYVETGEVLYYVGQDTRGLPVFIKSKCTAARYFTESMAEDVARVLFPDLDGILVVEERLVFE